MVNWEFFDNQTPESAVELVDELRAGDEVTATRGARVCTWREAERVLAGFPDDRADEGPAAGPASLVGLGLAREHGWKAPAASRPGATTTATPDQARQADPGDVQRRRAEPAGRPVEHAVRSRPADDRRRQRPDAAVDG